jgi:uncharacterized protein YkwD
MGRSWIVGSLVLFAALVILPLGSLAQHDEGAAPRASGGSVSGSEAGSGNPVLLAQAAEDHATPEASAGSPPEEEGTQEGNAGGTSEQEGGQPQGEEEAPADRPAAEPQEPGAQSEDGQGAPEAAPESPTPEPTSPPSSAPARITSEAEMRQGMLDAHAKARAAVGVPPLTWSSALAAHAQEWVDHLKNSGCKLAHRTENRQGYGENLHWASGGGSGQGPNQQIDVPPAEVVESWVREGADYNAATHTCAEGRTCGHYTQVVWKNTTEVGCAMTVCDDKSQIWICNYNPAGNVSGENPF